MNQHYHIKVEAATGRGLYANYDLRAGMVIASEELLVLSSFDTPFVNGTDLKYYTFKFDMLQDCLVLGDGELYNHSDDPNVGYKLCDHDGRKVMTFFTLKEVKTGEQLFIDYTDDEKVDTKKYVVNLIGTLK